MIRGFPLQTDGGFIDGSAPLLLTSAFPKVGDVRFYPLPVPLQRWLSADFLRENRKKVKKIRFVSEGIFRRMMNGERMDEWFREGGNGIAMQDGALRLTREEVPGLPRWIGEKGIEDAKAFSVSTVPRVAVGRAHPQSTIFHAGRLVMAQGCGFWFGAVIRDDAWEGWLETALSILADDGIGGERSAGHGGFEWARGQDVPLEREVAEGGYYVTLSRYHPRPSELPDALSDEGTGYELTSVGGWFRSLTGADQRRRRLWLAVEGSVLKATGGGPFGDVVDVKPVYDAGAYHHPVWRYGLAFPAALGGAS
jgi:CRISPR-associated protein Csm4